MDWKKQQNAVKQEHDRYGYAARFGDGLHEGAIGSAFRVAQLIGDASDGWVRMPNVNV
jgi:hypothetical protein